MPIFNNDVINEILKKYFVLVSLAGCLFISSTAQENTKFKGNIYKTWVSTSNYESTLRGVLYEIKDSSILISNSLLKQDYLSGNYTVSNISFKNIKNISLRSKNKLLVGSIIGTAAGIAGAVVIADGIAGKDEFIGVMALFGTPVIALGAGIGALVGSLRIYIPINGKFESFKSNENKLKRYSLVQEYYSGLNIYEQEFEHKWFIGLLAGPSIPSGDINNKIGVSTTDVSAKIGGIGSFILGYSINEEFGISASFSNSSYNLKNSLSEEWWSLTSILAGPMFSFPEKENSFILDLKPMIGYTNASFNVGDINEKSGNGLGIYPSIGLRYNFSRRWCALAETGYLFSNQKFDEGYKMTNSINFCLGAAYRFR